MDRMLATKIVYVSLLLLSVIFGIESVRLGFGSLIEPGPGFMPFIGSLLLCLLSLTALARNLRLIENPKERLFRVAEVKSSALVYAGILVYVVIIEYLGFFPSTFVFLLYLFKAIRPQKWSTAVIAAIMSAGVSYLVFVYFLKIQFV